MKGKKHALPLVRVREHAVDILSTPHHWGQNSIPYRDVMPQTTLCLEDNLCLYNRSQKLCQVVCRVKWVLVLISVKGTHLPMVPRVKKGKLFD